MLRNSCNCYCAWCPPPHSVTLATPLKSILKDYLGNVHIWTAFKILLQLCLWWFTGFKLFIKYFNVTFDYFFLFSCFEEVIMLFRVYDCLLWFLFLFFLWCLHQMFSFKRMFGFLSFTISLMPIILKSKWS